MLPRKLRPCLHQPACLIFTIIVLLALGVTGPGALAGQTFERSSYEGGKKVLSPQMFAEGVVSTELDEAGGVFSPNSTDFYFTVLAPYTTAPRFGMICVSHFADGRWQKPQTVSFSGRYMDFAPHLSTDGSKMFFTSIRPLPESKVPRYRIWMAERIGGEWAEPMPLPAPINQAAGGQNLVPLELS